MRLPALLSLARLPLRAEKTGLFIDIGSGSVGAAIASYGHAGQPATILYATRAPLAAMRRGSLEKLTDAMIAAVDIALNEALTKGIPSLELKTPFDSVTVTLAAPWFVSRTKLISYEKEQPYPVTHSLMKELLSRAESEIRAEDGSVPGEAMEHAVMQTMLNGYPTARPIGKRARTMKLMIYQSFVEPEARRRVIESVERAFHRSDASFQSFSLASFHALRGLHPETESFLMLDASGELTELSLVSEGSLLESHSFPHATRTIARSASDDGDEAAGKHAAQAHFKAKKVTAKSAELEAENASSAAPIDKAARAWLSDMCKALADIKSRHALPHTLYLLAEPEAMSWFSQIIAANDFSISCKIDHPFDVIALDSAALQKFIILKGTGAAFEPFTCLPLLFFHMKEQGRGKTPQE